MNNSSAQPQTMLGKVGRYPFLAEPFHCDFSQHLFMGHLGNHLLNAADYHSADRGFGMAYLSTIHRTWVLSRLAIEMTTMPRMYDRFYVETWVENAMRYFTSRNFRIESADGEPYGFGRSIWAMIDTDTRQPADLLSINDGLIMQYIEADKACPVQPVSRVRVGTNVELVRSIDTHYSDVDINGHINSIKYLEHVLDLGDLSWHKAHSVRRIEIAYVAESHQGDRLNFYRETASDDTYRIRITKSSPAENGETEVARCQITLN